MGVHLQLLVGAVGMERKMNSSVGLCLALEPEMETKVELTRLNRLDHLRRCLTLFPTGRNSPQVVWFTGLTIQRFTISLCFRSATPFC